MAETKKPSVLDFTRSGLPNVRQSKYRFLSSGCCLFTDYTNASSMNMSIHTTNSIMISHTMHYNIYIGYITAFFLKVGFECWFGGNVHVTKVGCANHALHYQDPLNLNCLNQDPCTTTGTCGRLINKFALLHRHIWDKCLKHLATSSTRNYFAPHSLTCISSDAINVLFTLHHNSLALVCWSLEEYLHLQT